MAGEMNMILQNMMERLRPLTGSKGWDYCVLWKLSEDQRFVEWMSCCCGGAENSQNNLNNNGGDEEFLFPVSPLIIPCRDTMFQHQRTNSCDFLSELPTSMPLDSGIYAQTLISNQPSWLNSTSSTLTCSHFFEETIGTRVLIPLPGGLVELFVNKQIPEDQNVIDFITSQCNISSTPLDHQNQHQHQHNHDVDDQSMMMNNFIMMSCESQSNGHDLVIQPPVSPFESLNLSGATPYDEDAIVAVDHANNEDQQEADREASNNKNENEKSKKHERVRSNNSLSDCSDQVDEEDAGDGKSHGRKSGKVTQCKNLVAERRRRKKLNERLYTLRSLVPNISKLDRAAILGDAIEYVKDLQRQAKELQDELEEHSENDATNGAKRNNPASEILKFGPKSEHENSTNDFPFETSANNNNNNNGMTSKQNLDSDSTANDKAQEMEPQVEVAQIDGNEFFVKVFCEHKPGRFVRLMEAFHSLALEVTNANVTTFRNLVSNVLKVEKKDSKMVVQADHLRDFLLELTRNPSRGLCEMSKAPENGNNIDYHNHHHHYHHQQNY